ncbi:hypothetical protein [Brevibacillus sp. HD1.4A]|uniref:hypothetical protein n=1 Tax=Brevibacillus sp. HD1.4A TaxID=2738978 RepID=UPI00156BD5D2|nr:hypothetical protein [Brevibacillus sp. HD1.4A]NRQ55711.1 hypothetical protein [Brevibacillus sp. HD1.4A]
MIKTMFKVSVVALTITVGATAIPVNAMSNDEVLESIELGNFELSEEQREALNLADEIEQLLIDNELMGEKKNELRAAVNDSNTAKLRSGNFIEGILDSDEGLSASEISRVYKIGVDATNTAEEYYKSDSQLRDAYRHFIWNFNAANDKKLGKSKTRTATINHEWGLLLIDDAVDYYNNSFKKYVRLGMIGSDAMNAAFSDTINELPKMKKNKIKSLSSFKDTATKGNIMDWNNNYYGIYYSYMSDVDQAFKQAKPFLILAESKVSSSDYKKVYEGGFWK